MKGHLAEEVNFLATRFCDAALDQSLCPDVFKELTIAFESEAIDLLTLDHQTGLIPFSESYKTPVDIIEPYDEDHYIKFKPSKISSQRR